MSGKIYAFDVRISGTLDFKIFPRSLRLPPQKNEGLATPLTM
jgi:hypothetical protein